MTALFGPRPPHEVTHQTCSKSESAHTHRQAQGEQHRYFTDDVFVRFAGSPPTRWGRTCIRSGCRRGRMIPSTHPPAYMRPSTTGSRCGSHATHHYCATNVACHAYVESATRVCQLAPCRWETVHVVPCPSALLQPQHDRALSPLKALNYMRCPYADPPVVAEDRLQHRVPGAAHAGRPAGALGRHPLVAVWRPLQHLLVPGADAGVGHSGLGFNTDPPGGRPEPGPM